MRVQFQRLSGAYRDYRVTVDGVAIGKVRHTDHSRLGDRWKAYDRAGTEVCEATSRQAAAGGLVEARV
jgi:hypothetical protein